MNYKAESISRGQPSGTLPEIDVDSQLAIFPSFEIDVTEPFPR